MTSAPLASVLFVAAGVLATGGGLVLPAAGPGGAPTVAHADNSLAQPQGAVPPADVNPAASADLVVAADSVLGLQLETPVSTRAGQVEDPVEARVTRDLMVGGRVAVPTGTRALGSVTILEKGGKDKQPRLGIRFHALVLPSGTRIDVDTEPILRDAGSANASLTRVGGGAAGGAVVGAILGGTRGAAIGGALGATGAAVTAPDRADVVELRAGTALNIRTLSQFRVTAPGTR
ncbi:MAG TPA: hypothetical protein VK911_14760 [Vicinamibacterales bacterium]|nr:hypothetical protein [Vicinamibacterales bacterium]